MKLIINADDFGLSKGVNFGILEAYNSGIVTSATLMTEMPAFDHAVELAKQYRNLSVGVHLTLTAGKPNLDTHKTIMDSEGNFLKQLTLIDNLSNIDLNEVYSEFDAQINKVLNTGLKVTHLDGHHHVHSFGNIPTVVVDLCRKYNLGVRYINEHYVRVLKDKNIKSTESFSSEFHADGVSIENFMKIIEENDSESLEIMCHTAFIDRPLYENTSYGLDRIYELDILTSEEIKDFIKSNSNNIELTNFSSI